MESVGVLIFCMCMSTEDKSDDRKDSTYNILESVFDQLPKYHINILTGYFNAKDGQEQVN